MSDMHPLDQRALYVYQGQINRAVLDTLKDMQTELDALHTQLAYQRQGMTAMLDMLRMLGVDAGLIAKAAEDTKDSDAPESHTQASGGLTSHILDPDSLPPD